MEKTINIDDREVRLKAVGSFAIRYKNQFGADILTTLMPALDEMMPAFMSGKKDIMKDKQAIQAVFNGLAKIGITPLYELFWVLAKEADESIDPPEQWLSSFEALPLDIVFQAVLDVLVPTLISTNTLSAQSKKK